MMNRQALITSILLHTLVLVAFVIHLPRPKIETAPLIPLTVIPIAEFTASPKRAQKAVSQPSVAEAAQETLSPEIKDSADPSPQESEESVNAAAIIKKLATPKEIKTPKNLKEPKDTIESKTAEKKLSSNDFNSLLKNLQKSEPKGKSHGDTEGPTIDSDHIADKLSLSEMDALRQQLQKCWMIPAGARNAEDLVIEARVIVGPDAKVQQVELLDQGRMKKDAFFRAAAESAKRSLFHPECTPLKLPLDKYQQWKIFLITFNPQEILK